MTAPGAESTVATGTLMAGKRGLIMGVANDKSIAWGIARACHEQGAEMAFSYQGEALGKRVAPLAESIGCELVLECDVTDAASMDALFTKLEAEWGTLDFVVHAIGFSDKNELRGRYVDTSAENFRMTMDISVYSFTAVAQRADVTFAQFVMLTPFPGTIDFAKWEKTMGIAPQRIGGIPLTRHWLIPQALRPKLYCPHPVIQPIYKER